MFGTSLGSLGIAENVECSGTGNALVGQYWVQGLGFIGSHFPVLCLNEEGIATPFPC